MSFEEKIYDNYEWTSVYPSDENLLVRGEDSTKFVFKLNFQDSVLYYHFFRIY